MEKREFKILSPTAILGYGFPPASFMKGIERGPDLIGVDAGSTDPGPSYLGSGKSFTNRVLVKRDLRYMLSEGIRRGIPVIIGTAGGSGAKPHLEWCRKIIEEIAVEENLTFTMGLVSADVDSETVLSALRNGMITPLQFVPQLEEADVRESEYIVAQMGVEPLIEAHSRGCDVILAGRCYDPAVFAAIPISRGYDPGLALHMGKILECAAIAATPGSGSDCVMGILKKDSFILEALSDKRIFTKESTAAHTLYEKADPYHLHGPGGTIELDQSTFTEIGDGRVEVKGSRYTKADTYRVKLEGARRSGYRSISIAGTRDPIMISDIDTIISDVNAYVSEVLEKEGMNCSVYFHVYGRNGVMGNMEPVRNGAAHELAILIEAIGKTEEEAEASCSITRSTLLHFGYDGRISTAGNLAFPFSPSDIPMGPVYEFSIYHLMEVRAQDLFPITMMKVSAAGVRR